MPSASAEPESTDPLKTFIVPDTWRPAVMYIINLDDESEKRRQVTPQIRNAIVGDLVPTMYAHVGKPDKSVLYSCGQEIGEKNTLF